MIRLNIKNFHPTTAKPNWDNTAWCMQEHWGKKSAIELHGHGKDQLLLIFNENFSLSLCADHLEELKTQLLQRA
jgi:hypothetical protein